MLKLRSYRKRPPHLGPFPLETLRRRDFKPDLSALPSPRQTSFQRPGDPLSIVNAMGEYQSMLDAIREGGVKAQPADIPKCPSERSRHIKAFGYYCDASMVGICEIPKSAWLKEPFENPDVRRLAEKIRTMQTKTFAAGIDVIMAMLKEALKAPLKGCEGHTHAIVFLYDMPRDPDPEEPGADWIAGALEQRTCLRASETAVTLANYIRLLGRSARAHSQAASDVDLPRLAVMSGLAVPGKDGPSSPFLGTRFGLAAITTSMSLEPDLPLEPGQRPGLGWRLGTGANSASAGRRDPYAKRRYVDGPHPFETLRRVDTPTTYIDAKNVARVPKRANMFARSLFGDLGKNVQESAKNGNYARKSAAAFAFRPSLGALTLLQDGEASGIHESVSDPERNAANIKAALYFLGLDAVGISECPDWAYYSHDAAGNKLEPYHTNAISMIVDQGHETMEGASGDDWIACAQSMRAYLRFSLLGGVLAQHIRNLGYTARVHTVMDDEVLHPPLLLLSGLGEVSRIGEVILNPFLGPRLKSGVVTTSMPMAHDRPIDFGLQRFCESCNKCARECPSGAITAGPKLMFNGYEIWKSDSQKCTTYRVAQKNGSMCGRCMKTCPWNLEGLFAEAPFRWMAMNMPFAAKGLAKLDDILGKGGINPVKKWWWDLEMEDEGPYQPSRHPVNRRDLSKGLNLKYEDQTLAVYPAPLAPPPYSWPFPMDREAGIKAYKDMVTAEEHRRRRAEGLPPEHVYTADRGKAPVMQVVVSKAERMTGDIIKYEFQRPGGGALPKASAGAHIDVVVAPEFFRQYSLSGDPEDRGKYQIAVLREAQGKGGSILMHRIFEPGRRVFISEPANHFPLDEGAAHTCLMGGGIGVTPLIAMAHRLHRIGASFEMHYSCSRKSAAGFLDDLGHFPWAGRVQYHFSDQGTRVDLGRILRDREGCHVYACGPDRYMQSVMDAAAANGFDESQLHMEYFSVPEQPEYENHDFRIKLADSGRTVDVPADMAATDALLQSGVRVDVKCSDGLCGVCKCQVMSGEVEHRDFVLSKKERETHMILCQSRAAKPGGAIEIRI